MKHNYLTLIITLFVTTAVFGQSDTLLWEDFEAETIDYIEIDYPNGEPNLHPIWLNFDVDGIGDGSGASPERADEWFLAFGFADVDSTNTVLASNSWLQGEANGAENWLITPRVHIQDDQATLYWKSAPFQLPRYMDGYQVLVSTSDNLETSFTDTIAVFSEFDGNLTTDNDDTATYVFTPGIIHTEIEYDSADVTRHGGVLQQWERSLAAYENQSIFIAFRHRSDDDNLISIDDVLILGNGTVGIDEPESPASFAVYPNPARAGESVTVEYNLPQMAKVGFTITSIDGRLMHEHSGHVQLAGQHKTEIDITNLNSGSYLIHLNVGNTAITEQLIIVE